MLEKPLKRLMDGLVYLLFRTAMGLLRRLPLRCLSPLAGLLTWLFCLVLPGRVRIAQENIALALGNRYTHAQRKRLARDSIRQFILSTLEFPRIIDNVKRLDKVVRVEQIEIAQASMAHGKGVIAMAAHFGLWDLGGCAFSHWGYPVFAVAREMDNPYIHRYVTGRREQMGVGTIPQRGAVLGMVRQLSRGNAVAVLADQHASRDSVTVPLFGQPASTVVSVARLAMQTGALVVPFSVLREGPMRHVCRVYPPLELVHTGDREADVRANTALMNQAYERMILDRPDHWLWIHRRWKALDRQRRRAAETQGEARVS